MADRADFLARTLVTRLADLHDRFVEDDRGEPGRRERIEIIEKVLAIELGVTDGPTIALIETAAPSSEALQQGLDVEMSRFAEFLRARLHDQLSAS